MKRVTAPRNTSLINYSLNGWYWNGDQPTLTGALNSISRRWHAMRSTFLNYPLKESFFLFFFFCIGYVLVATFHTMMSNFVLLGCYERRAGKFVFVCLCWVTHVFSNITISTNRRTSSKLRRWMPPIRFVVCIVSFLHLFQPEIVYLMLTHPRQCRFQCGKLKNTFEWKEESEEDVAQCEKYGIVCGLNAYKLPRKFQNANGWLTWHSVVINVSISGNNRSGRCWNDKLKTQKKLMESLKWCYFCWPSQLHSTNYKIKLIAYQCDAKAAGKQQIGKMNSS